MSISLLGRFTAPQELELTRDQFLLVRNEALAYLSSARQRHLRRFRDKRGEYSVVLAYFGESTISGQVQYSNLATLIPGKGSLFELDFVPRGWSCHHLKSQFFLPRSSLKLVVGAAPGLMAFTLPLVGEDGPRMMRDYILTHEQEEVVQPTIH